MLLVDRRKTVVAIRPAVGRRLGGRQHRCSVEMTMHAPGAVWQAGGDILAPQLAAAAVAAIATMKIGRTRIAMMPTATTSTRTTEMVGPRDRRNNNGTPPDWEGRCRRWSRGSGGISHCTGRPGHRKRFNLTTAFIVLAGRSTLWDGLTPKVQERLPLQWGEGQSFG